MKYRVEKKYIVTDVQIALLKSKFSQFMGYDKNQPTGTYTIRSLYFDDYDNSCYWENEDSIGQREKFRLRIYNGKTDVIKLEEKSKYLEYIGKQMTPVTLENCRKYLIGEVPPLEADDDFLIKKLYSRMQMSYLRPTAIVEYERTAYVDMAGNVRITFDRNISGSNEVEKFLDKELMMIPVLPTGQHVMEVKYDEFLPDYIRNILMEESLQRDSFSKYYYTRNNEMLY